MWIGLSMRMMLQISIIFLAKKDVPYWYIGDFIMCMKSEYEIRYIGGVHNIQRDANVTVGYTLRMGALYIRVFIIIMQTQLWRGNHISEEITELIFRIQREGQPLQLTFVLRREGIWILNFNFYCIKSTKYIILECAYSRFFKPLVFAEKWEYVQI